MNKEDFIKEVKGLAVDFWTMNLHNGTFEERLNDLVNKREQAIDYAHSSTQLPSKQAIVLEMSEKLKNRFVSETQPFYIKEYEIGYKDSFEDMYEWLSK